LDSFRFQNPVTPSEFFGRRFLSLIRSLAGKALMFHLDVLPEDIALMVTGEMLYAVQPGHEIFPGCYLSMQIPESGFPFFVQMIVYPFLD
jgi:hypothetical protein